MTIRELMKVYKKVNKCATQCGNAMAVLHDSVYHNWGEIENALTLANKAVRTLRKMAATANVDFEVFMSYCDDEDSFIMWARANKLDFSKESNDENDEENDE